MEALGAVVLCGGRSTRMGRPKAWLPFGESEVLLQRVVRRIAPAVGPIVVVAAPEQPVPPLPSDVRLVRDPIEGEGPLRGIASGLAALAERARHAFVTTTDAPFLTPAFIRRLHALCSGYDIAVPRAEGREQPLAAVYATHLFSFALELLESGRRRPIFLFERARTRIVSAEETLADETVQRDDPNLASLRNINTAEDYQAALREATDLS